MSPIERRLPRRDPRLEASEADLAENELIEADAEPELPRSLPGDAAEADALEQSRLEPLDDDEDRR